MSTSPSLGLPGKFSVAAEPDGRGHERTGGNGCCLGEEGRGGSWRGLQAVCVGLEWEGGERGLQARGSRWPCVSWHEERPSWIDPLLLRRAGVRAGCARGCTVARGMRWRPEALWRSWVGG